MKVRSFIKQHILLAPDDRLLVAVSGGPDSMCLMYLLSKWAKRQKWDLKIAYFDHNLRKESKQEIRFIQKHADALGIPFCTGDGQVRKLQLSQKLSLEEAARALRFSFLKREADRHETKKIVLAQHTSDQVETFFVHLLKGSGLSGLSGMKPKTNVLGYEVIRPLLSVTKEEILSYLKARKIPFKQDESNRDENILRNRVRIKLIPYIKKHFMWNIHKHLPRMMEVFKAEHEVLEEMIHVWEVEHVRETEQGCVIETVSFKKLPVALQRRMIKRVLDRFSKRRNYTSLHIEQNRQLFFNAVSRKYLKLPEGLIATKQKHAVTWHTI